MIDTFNILIYNICTDTYYSSVELQNMFWYTCLCENGFLFRKKEGKIQIGMEGCFRVIHIIVFVGGGDEFSRGGGRV